MCKYMLYLKYLKFKNNFIQINDLKKIFLAEIRIYYNTIVYNQFNVEY